MKKLAIAVGSILTALAPAVFAEDDAPLVQRTDQYGNVYSIPENKLDPWEREHGYGYRDSRESDRGARDWRDERDSRGGRARVIETRPVYEAANQQEECWNPRAGHYETRRDEHHGSNIGKGTVLGALAGGVVGHQFSHGTGTAAGAVIGGLVGNQVDRRNNDDDQPDLDLSRCRVVADSSNVQAYDVRYAYRGREYTARMDHDPGRYLDVGRDVNRDGTPFASVAQGDVNSWR